MSPKARPMLAELRDRLRRGDEGAWVLVGSTGIGFLLGLLVVLFRDQIVPYNYGRDARKIWNIANRVDPDFVDQSFTPVASVYRVLGLAESPTIAAIAGYLFAAVVLVVALLISRRTTANYPLGLFVIASFVLSAVFLGQYSKDVLILPVALLLLVLPRAIWFDVVAIAAMLGYAAWFRSYWALVIACYVVYRLITIWQTRMRYLLLGGAAAAVAIGFGFFLLKGMAPNRFRTTVLEFIEANTALHPLWQGPQPWSGAVDVFLDFWFIQLPLPLPFVAGAVYLAAAVGIAFVRLYPLWSVRSAIRWPGNGTRDGAVLRRGLSLVLAFVVVQALFEPDYSSAIRHFTPMLPLMIAIVQASRSGTRRVGRASPFSWGGGAARLNSGGHLSRRQRRAMSQIG